MDRWGVVKFAVVVEGVWNLGLHESVSRFRV